jgi:hypothetical protein
MQVKMQKCCCPLWRGSAFVSPRYQGSGSDQAKQFMEAERTPLSLLCFREIPGQRMEARCRAGLPKELVLYRARHDYGTRVLCGPGTWLLSCGRWGIET